jgi:hypothetical protein
MARTPRTSRLLAVSILLGLSACGGDGPTGTGAPQLPSDSTALPGDTLGTPPDSTTPDLQLDSTTFRIATIGDSILLQARVGSRSTGRPTLELVTERRWMSEAPVLSAGALARSVVLAQDAGTARLAVSAFGAGPDTVTVQVRPAAPYVRSIAASEPLAPGDSIVVRGYRLQDVAAGSVTEDGLPASVTSRDSATITLKATVADAAACRGAARTVVRVEQQSRAYARRREGVLALRVGDTLRFSTADARCLKLPAIPGAEYALAWADPRPVRRSAIDGKGFLVADSSFEVRVLDRSSAASSASAFRRPGRAPFPRVPAPSDAGLVRLAGRGPRASLVDRTTPLAVGDTFHFQPTGFDSAQVGRVRKIYGGYFVLAVMDRDSAKLTPAWQAEFDRTMALMLKYGRPYLRRTVFATDPELHAGMGQTVIVAAELTGAASYAGLGLIQLKIDGSSQISTAAPLLVAHELSHTYQWSLRIASSCGGQPDCQIGFTRWALEGGADFLAHEILRETGSYDFGANLTTFGVGAPPDLPAFWAEPVNAFPLFQAGYNGSAEFFRYLTARLMEKGLAYDAAVKLAMEGALEGWYHFDTRGTPVVGLVERVAPYLGAGWSPVEAQLRWAAMNAADDLVPQPGFQNPTFRYSGRSDGKDRVLRTGLGQAVVRTGQGGTTAFQAVLGGSVGYFLLQDDDVGGSLSYEASIPDVEWLLIRTR